MEQMEQMPQIPHTDLLGIDHAKRTNSISSAKVSSNAFFVFF